MKTSKKTGITVALLLLAVVPLLATTWFGPDARAVAADDTTLWSTSDVLTEIRPGLNNDKLRTTAEGELECIRRTLENEGISYAHEQAFRIYSMVDVDIIKQFEEKGSLGECISTDYRWNVPLVSGKLTTGTAKLAADKDGTWSVVSYGSAQLEECALLSNLSKISELLADNGLKNVTDIKAAYLPLYRTTMLYIRADGQEYAMAANEARFTDIETYKVYTAKEFVAAFERAFGRLVPYVRTPLEEIPIGVNGSKAK